MNIVLCGMMGCGKTTVGLALAKKTEWRWYDTDGLIVDRYGKISDIFEYYGEPYFRSLETQIAKELSAQDGLILSTGGGMVLKAENAALLKDHGKIVFLRASKETLAQRLTLDGTRPLLQSKEEKVLDRLQRLLMERTPVYESVSDLTVDVDGKTPEAIAEEILRALEVKCEGQV
ncbi:MAG: shikimate kinase [Clostridia bacterium]|nr:shikimate kinase [Clostridia bacterium]